MSSIDPKLLELLACPATRQKLAQADSSVLAKLNARIAAGGVKSVGGQAVGQPVEAGLVREDGQILYAIRDGIPVLLVDEGIPLGD
ncbi:MAG: hypothetical protein R3F17_00440 [Planctomycetota bacterium]